MTRLASLLALVFACACSSDGNDKPDGSASLDRTVAGQETGGGHGDLSKQGDQIGVKGDAPKGTDSQTVPPGVPGAICTQQNKTCGAGLKCVFLDAWNAPKGTCVREATGGCASWDDPRCAVTGFKYSVMCGPYTENKVTTSICLLLCKLNGQTYDCPPQHTCKSVNGYDVCLPQ